MTSGENEPPTVAPFPGGYQPGGDGFKEAFEKHIHVQPVRPARKQREPRRQPYSIWLLVKTIEAMATIAAIVLLIKFAVLMIILFQPW